MQKNTEAKNTGTRPNSGSQVQLKFHDATPHVIADNASGTSKKRPSPSSSPGIIGSFAVAATTSDDEETAVLPSYYITAQGARLPSIPLEHMAEDKRVKLYTSSSPEDYAARRVQLQQVVIHCEEQLIALRRRRAAVRGEMRQLLQQFLELERENTEVNCRLEGALTAQAELDKRHNVTNNSNN